MVEKTIEFYKEENERLKQLISDAPESEIINTEDLQRLWEATCSLIEKSEIKFICRYINKLHKELKRKTNIIQKVENWYIHCEQWNLKEIFTIKEILEHLGRCLYK